MTKKQIPGPVHVVIGVAMVVMSAIADPIKLSIFIFAGAVLIVYGFFKIIIKEQKPKKHKFPQPHPQHAHPHHKTQHPAHKHHHAAQHKQHAQHKAHPTQHTHVVRCASCGVKLHPRFHFCPNCGQKMK
ncbi:hypothetical protein ACFL3V_02110 [Nanoarchaeota archaeon]